METLSNELAERLLRQLSPETRGQIKQHCRRIGYGWRTLKERLHHAMWAEAESDTHAILLEIGVPAKFRIVFARYLRSQRLAPDAVPPENRRDLDGQGQARE